MNASIQDVIGTSQNIQFQAGVTSGECKFTIADDIIPEANETFAIELIVTGSGVVVSPSVAYLTILANDDAFGIIGFNEVQCISVLDVRVVLMATSLVDILKL